MATKNKSTPAGASELTPRLDFYIADDIRLEVDSKVTAVGLYTDRVIVALMAPTQPEPTAELPMSLGNKAFVISLGGLEGTFPLSLEYVDPDLPRSKPKLLPQPYEFPSRDRTVNLIANFQPLIVGGFGTKTIVLTLNEQRYELPFEVQKGQAPTDPKTATEAAKSPLRPRAASKKIRPRVSK